MNEKTDSTEQTFAEDFAFLERVKKIKNNRDIEPFMLRMEYQVLAERYQNLLKTTVRLAKAGDKIQEKYMKLKENPG